MIPHVYLDGRQLSDYEAALILYGRRACAESILAFADELRPCADSDSNVGRTVAVILERLDGYRIMVDDAPTLDEVRAIAASPGGPTP